MKLSVIILSWNTKQLLRQCLQSLISNFELPIINYEIIIVDNGSNDGSPEMVEKFIKHQPSNIKLIRNKTNLGFARGNNQGIKIAKGKYIMLLNSDTVVKKRALEGLVEFLDDNPQVAAVSPILLNLDGSPQIDYYMKFPNLWQIFLYHNPVLRPLAMRTPLRWLIVGRTEEAQSFGVDQLPGAALMGPCEVWGKVGLLDEDYRFLYEDVDWCWRAKKLGYKLMVVPDAKIVHIGGASWKKKLKESSFEFYRQYFSSMLLFVKKNYGDLEFKIFRVALIIHFFLTLKPRLALYFLKTGGKQRKLWQ